MIKINLGVWINPRYIISIQEDVSTGGSIVSTTTGKYLTPIPPHAIAKEANAFLGNES